MVILSNLGDFWFVNILEGHAMDFKAPNWVLTVEFLRNEEVEDEVQPTQMDLDSQNDENGEAAKRNAEGSGTSPEKDKV